MPLNTGYLNIKLCKLLLSTIKENINYSNNKFFTWPMNGMGYLILNGITKYT